MCAHIYRKTDRSLRILFVIRNRYSKEPADKCLLEYVKLYSKYCDYKGVDSYTTLTKGWLTQGTRHSRQAEFKELSGCYLETCVQRCQSFRFF